MAALEIHCLGGISLVQDGLLLDDLKMRKGLALLCFLAVNKKNYSRSTLAGLLWADMPESNARMNLRKTLNRLKPFSPYLTITRESLSVNPSASLWVDVAEFEAVASDRTNIPRLQAAVSLYQGDFLEGFNSDDLPLFHEWVLSQQSILRETLLDILWVLIAHFTRQQDYPAAINYLHILLKFESWHEEAHQSLIRLLALSGQRSAAIKQFEICQRILENELGVEPSEETFLLYKQVISGKLDEVDIRKEPAHPFHPIPFVHSLPAQDSPLIGRVSERAELKTYLQEPIIRLISIIGAGGMGKTHLALSTAHDLSVEQLLFEEIIYVPLGQVTTRQNLIIALANPLNLKLAGAHNPEKLLLDHLHSRQALIILDNFEQLLSEVDFLERILVAAPRIKLLITSRERLKIHQEWILDLHGLPFPDSEDDIHAGHTDAVQLFAQRAHALRQNFSLEKNLKAVAQICIYVQGMPLALELAASWIRVLTVKEIANHIANNLDALSTDLRGFPERHRTMQSVFDSSWRWLSAEEQSVMGKLSVFTGGFTLQAAIQVAGASVPILSTLVDKSFLSRDPRTQDVTRYEIHELICQYAYNQLQGIGQADTAHFVHLEYFLTLAEKAEQFWDTSEEKEWLSKLESERGNLHTALQYALDQKQVELLLRLNAALFTFWIYKSPSAESSYWLRAALALPWDHTNPAVQRSRAKALNVAGYAAVVVNNFDQARAYFKEGLSLFECLGDSKGISWSVRGCGFIDMCQGKYKQAQSYIENSRLICQRTGDKWGLAWSVFDLGYLKMVKGELDEAKTLLEDALEQLHRLGIQFGEYRTQIALGYTDYILGNWNQAAAFYRQAFLLQQQNSFFQHLASALEGTAYIAAAAGKINPAVQLLGAAKTHRDSFGFQRHLHYAADYHKNLEQLKERLKKKDFTLLWEDGTRMNPEQAVTFALSEALAYFET